MTRVTVLGMGHGGTAMAADLTLKGHDVTLVKTSGKMHDEHQSHLLQTGLVCLEQNGTVRSATISRVTEDVESSVRDAEIIVVFIQTNYHAQLLSRFLPYITNTELLLFEPGYLSTAYALEFSAPPTLAIAEATSSPLDCRIISPGHVQVSFQNVANHVGVFPCHLQARAATLLDALQYPWIHLSSPIEAALHNPNLIVHTVGAIMSIPRIEYTGGNYWMYREVFTPTVWNMVEALDNEKMTILASLGFERLPYVDACRQRNSLDQTRSGKEVFYEYAMNSSVSGPSDVRSRYITEDVPEGLVLLESLGSVLGIGTPVCSSLIDLASAALGTDFRVEGRNVARLGPDNLKRIVSDAQGGTRLDGAWA